MVTKGKIKKSGWVAAMMIASVAMALIFSACSKSEPEQQAATPAVKAVEKAKEMAGDAVEAADKAAESARMLMMPLKVPSKRRRMRPRKVCSPPMIW